LKVDVTSGCKYVATCNCPLRLSGKHIATFVQNIIILIKVLIGQYMGQSAGLSLSVSLWLRWAPMGFKGIYIYILFCLNILYYYLL